MAKDVIESRYYSDLGLAKYLNCGRSMARKISIEAGARKKVGGRAFNDKQAIDAYMENLPADNSIKN